MNTVEIQQLMEGNEHTRMHFRGVFSADEIPRDDGDKRNFLIVNLDPSSEPGSHWVAMMRKKGAVSEYFDSFGFPVPYESFKRFLGGRWIRSKEQLQSDKSTTCGQWCMYYIWKRCKKCTFFDIVEGFKGMTREENDFVVRKFVEKEFKRKQLIGAAVKPSQNCVCQSCTHLCALHDKICYCKDD